MATIQKRQAVQIDIKVLLYTASIFWWIWRSAAKLTGKVLERTYLSGVKANLCKRFSKLARHKPCYMQYVVSYSWRLLMRTNGPTKDLSMDCTCP
jgi:hypothetical protein